MNLLLHKQLEIVKGSIEEFNDTPITVRIGVCTMCVIGTQLDPHISAEGKSIIGRVAIAVGVGSVIKIADTHRQRRHTELIETRIENNRAFNREKVDEIDEDISTLDE